MSVQATATEAEIRVAGDDSSGGSDQGLDLFLIRQLAEQWGGVVRIEARPGQGAAFVVTCPVSTVPRPLLPVARDQGREPRDRGPGT